MCPVKYDINNTYESAIPCEYCGGSGVQRLGGSLGYRTCQYCITGYKVKNCEYCGGQGCNSCVGTKHNFYNELSADAPAPVMPTSSTRPYAGEAAPAPPRTIFRR